MARRSNNAALVRELKRMNDHLFLIERHLRWLCMTDEEREQERERIRQSVTRDRAMRELEKWA